MVNVLLLKLALVTLAIACFVFGGLTARKGLDAVRRRRPDETPQNLAEGHFGPDAISLGSFVFIFGFFLLYLLSIF